MRSQCCRIVMSQIHGYDHITMRSQCCHRTMLTMWCHYDVSMISKLWHHMYELFVRSQWHELTTSLWGHSVVTVWCHRYTRWPHHHEVTVLSQDDAHSVMSSWHHYDITIKSSYVWVLCDHYTGVISRVDNYIRPKHAPQTLTFPLIPLTKIITLFTRKIKKIPFRPLYYYATPHARRILC